MQQSRVQDKRHILLVLVIKVKIKNIAFITLETMKYKKAEAFKDLATRGHHGWYFEDYHYYYIYFLRERESACEVRRDRGGRGQGQRPLSRLYAQCGG